MIKVINGTGTLIDKEQHPHILLNSLIKLTIIQAENRITKKIVTVPVDWLSTIRLFAALVEICVKSMRNFPLRIKNTGDVTEIMKHKVQYG